MLLAKDDELKLFDTWNFGPLTNKELKVSEIIKIFESNWKLPKIQYENGKFIESNILRINSSKANKQLFWEPKWDYEKIFTETIDWYRNVHTTKMDAFLVSQIQLDAYRKLHR